jgi:hypothetical protein
MGELKSAIMKQHMSPMGSPEFVDAFIASVRLAAGAMSDREEGHPIDAVTESALNGHMQYLAAVTHDEAPGADPGADPGMLGGGKITKYFPRILTAYSPSDTALAGAHWIQDSPLNRLARASMLVSALPPAWPLVPPDR